MCISSLMKSRHNVDDIVFAAIAPLVRQSLASWQPLQDPTLLVNVLRRWRHALKMSVMEKAQLDADVYGTRNFQSTTSVQDMAMTPYESLLWHSLLPKIQAFRRMAIFIQPFLFNQCCHIFPLVCSLGFCVVTCGGPTNLALE
ncbi:GC-rich sequence DNA-binding factor-like protein-domain-containing protein [Gautieria morchelliformis]|nr:GC-rich sequence DNA-binding factor-like protein-domain-containing protein [Gautieria morchelliformis]